MTKRIEAAKMPAHVSIMGQIESAGDTKIDIPDMSLNIGGHGGGHILKEILDWDPVEDEDGTLDGEMSLGDDIYIYAVADSSGIAKLVASKNKTAPDGYSTSESRRIGGFHFGRVRTIDQAYDESADLDRRIIPNSCWDLRHRPKCDPTGMVEVIPDSVWMDIYLSSEDGTDWPDTVPVSEYGATPISGDDGYNLYYDYIRLAKNAHKRLPLHAEWIAAAYGVPQGATDAGGRVSTGEHSDYGFECVSCLNLDQPSGNLWQTNSDAVESGGWNGTNTGKDEDNDHGETYLDRVLRAGGAWGSAAGAGARRGSRSAPWNVSSSSGLRCACDSL